MTAIDIKNTSGIMTHFFQVHGTDDKVSVCGDTCGDDFERHLLHLSHLSHLITPVLLTLTLQHNHSRWNTTMLTAESVRKFTKIYSGVTK